MGWFNGWLPLLYVAGAGIVLCGGLLYFYQDNLLYFPAMPNKNPEDNPQGYRSPAESGLPFEDVFMTTSDGVRIHGWLLKQPKADTVPTIVYFHGNAGNIGFRLPNAREMYQRLGCNIFMVDYRGYGKSEGVPSEKGLLLDAEAALKALRDDPSAGVDASQVVLFGRSLGGAVAFAAADKFPEMVTAVVVENTFLSISDMVDAVLPPLRFIKGLVLSIDWPNHRYAASCSLPILFLAGQRDELVPSFHMERLFDLATSSKLRRIHRVPKGGHNDTWYVGGDKYYEAIEAFIRDVDGRDWVHVDENCAAEAAGAVLTPTGSTRGEGEAGLDSGVHTPPPEEAAGSIPLMPGVGRRPAYPGSPKKTR